MKNEPVMRIKPGGIPYFTFDMESYPAEGGSLLHVEGTGIWYKGQKNMGDVVISLDLLKRLLKLFLKSLGSNWLLIPFVVLKWQSLISAFNNLSEVTLRRHNIFLDKFCISARELIRIADKMTTDTGKNVNTKKGIKHINKILDEAHLFLELFMVIICFYEYDIAYRWRSQFALNILDKDAFLKNPYLEAKRIMDEMCRREKDNSLKEKYLMTKHLLWVLKIPKIKRLAQGVVEEIDMSKILFDDDDKQWLTIGKEFDFS